MNFSLYSKPAYPSSLIGRKTINLITFVKMMLYHPINTVVNKCFRKTYQMKEMLSPIPTMTFQPPDVTGEHYNISGVMFSAF